MTSNPQASSRRATRQDNAHSLRRKHPQDFLPEISPQDFLPKISPQDFLPPPLPPAMERHPLAVIITCFCVKNYLSSDLRSFYQFAKCWRKLEVKNINFLPKQISENMQS